MLSKVGVILRILIDADGCPVVDNTIKIAKKHKIEVIILCDTSHVFEREGAETIMVSKGADSVDFKLVNMTKQGDIVITQDYGLAAMCLAKKTIPINQNGLIYTNENIDMLLLARHNSKMVRKAGGRLRGPAKRTNEQDIAFDKTLNMVIERIKNESI
jgi:uncharacterized protein YaiI (UPF0178 family)